MARHTNLVGRSFPERQMEITASPTQLPSPTEAHVTLLLLRAAVYSDLTWLYLVRAPKFPSLETALQPHPS